MYDPVVQPHTRGGYKTAKRRLSYSICCHARPSLIHTDLHVGLRYAM